MSQTRVQLVGNVGTGASFAGIVTASSFSGDGSGLTGVGIGSEGSINTVGIITAAAFYGDGSNLTGAGIGSDTSVNTTGIITASKFVGAEFEGSGDKLIFSPSPLSYSPGIGSTGVTPTTNIVVTFDQQVQAGSGTVTLRTVSAAGTIFESFNVGTSSSITFSNNTVTLNPTGFLDSGTTYYAVFPQGTVQNYIGGNALEINSYYFETSEAPVATTFSPAVGVVTDAYTGNIEITYDQPITAATGTITLRTGSRTGTIVESFDVTTDVTIVSDTLTINPTNDLNAGLTYYVVIPAGAITNNIGLSVVDGQLDYYFTTNAALYMWGTNAQGQLGQNNRTEYSSPIQIPGSQWGSTSGFRYQLATKTDGTLWSWGSNLEGQLGQNNTTEYSSPVQIPGNSWSSIDTGDEYSLATKTDGTLWSWGSNLEGQLGQNNTTEYSSPVQIPGNQWSSINTGYIFSLATKTDGTLWSWGDNIFGQLGQNNTTQYSSPVQIPGNQWNYLSSNNNYSLATKTDGTLWSWGENNEGQLGQNNTTSYSSPVQIPGTSWSVVSSRDGGHVLATKTDRTLWSWGQNTLGQLAQNNRTEYSSPVQIPGTQWSVVSVGDLTSYATKTDGTLWSFGSGQSGRLGHNNQDNYSSPVQIPGTSWSIVDGGYIHAAATQRI